MCKALLEDKNKTGPVPRGDIAGSFVPSSGLVVGDLSPLTVETFLLISNHSREEQKPGELCCGDVQKAVKMITLVVQGLVLQACNPQLLGKLRQGDHKFLSPWATEEAQSWPDW